MTGALITILDAFGVIYILTALLCIFPAMWLIIGAFKYRLNEYKKNIEKSKLELEEFRKNAFNADNEIYKDLRLKIDRLRYVVKEARDKMGYPYALAPMSIDAARANYMFLNKVLEDTEIDNVNQDK